MDIKDVLSKSVDPIRANLFKDKMYITGTGLSVASCVSVQNSCTNDVTKDFYHTPYHSAVKAVKGETLLLNIYHVQGRDCGYTFTLNANPVGNISNGTIKFSQKFQCVYKSCYQKQISTLKIQKSVIVNSNKNLFVKKDSVAKIPVAPKESKATFIVRDSLKHTSIESEISFIKNSNGISPELTLKEKGKYEFRLEKNRGYHLLFSAIGYKSMDVVFITTDTLHSFSNDVDLTPLKEGDNFVMDNIYFHPNSYYLKGGSQEELDKLFSYLKSSIGTTIEIQGHTNGSKRIKGSYKSNFKGSAKKLSQMRAEKIKKYLVDKGISSERISSIGYGGSKPIFPKPKNQAQANKNIRVEVLILSQKESVMTQTAKPNRLKNSR